MTIQELPDHQARIVETVQSITGTATEVETVRAVLFLKPSRTEATNSATVCDVVKGHNHLGDQGRVAKRVRRHNQTDG